MIWILASLFWNTVYFSTVFRDFFWKIFFAVVVDIRCNSSRCHLQGLRSVNMRKNFTWSQLYIEFYRFWVTRYIRKQSIWEVRRIKTKHWQSCRANFWVEDTEALSKRCGWRLSACWLQYGWMVDNNDQQVLAHVRHRYTAMSVIMNINFITRQLGKWISVSEVLRQTLRQCIYTPWAIKTCRFVFHHNSGVSCCAFSISGNRNE